MGVKDFLQGKWLGHPLHPALVHVPVGVWTGALIFDLAGLSAGAGNLFFRLSFYSIALGLAGAVLAIPPGWIDWSEIKREKPAWKLGIYHLVLNAAATLVWLTNLLVRIPHLQEAQQVTPTQLGLSIAATALLFTGAWFGGRMVFDQGTSVARLSKGRWRKIAEKGQSRLPE